jgi:hypothetical protein
MNKPAEHLAELGVVAGVEDELVPRGVDFWGRPHELHAPVSLAEVEKAL